MQAEWAPSYKPGVNKNARVVALLAIALISAGAVVAEEYQPAGRVYTMQGHLDWCGEAKTTAAKIKRYEQFWKDQAPKEPDGYDDSLHIRLVRRCAYRLAELYAEAERNKDCMRMLKWLEKEDEAFAVEKE